VRTLAHRTKLTCRPEAAVYLVRACGLRRLAYNWALAEQGRHYRETGKSLTGYDLVKRFNAIKGEKYPWCREFSKWIPQLAQMACWDALKRFFKTSRGYPRFKRKGKARDSFQVGQGGVTFEPSGRVFRLASSEYRFKITRPIRFPGRILRTTISREPDGWWCSFLVEVEDQWSYPHCCETQAAGGVDLGIQNFMTLAGPEGTEYHHLPEELKRLDRRTRRAQRVLARRQKGSRRRARQANRVARLQQRARRVRLEAIHRLTSMLVRRFRHLGVEQLNIQGMVRNPRLAHAISQQGWGITLNQLGYKAPLAGATLVEAGQWYPSSKTCSSCGHVLDALPLGTRHWACPACGSLHCRDGNAAQNLRGVALKFAAGSHPEALNARGGDVSLDSPVLRNPTVERSPMKRESRSSLVNQDQSCFARSPE
jgi:putative transposase